LVRRRARFVNRRVVGQTVEVITGYSGIPNAVVGSEGGQRMDDDEIRRRLEPISVAKTLIDEVGNTIVRVDSDAVVVRSDRTANDRTIMFNDIRRRSTSNGRIVGG
jgi:hypothetical protein